MGNSLELLSLGLGVLILTLLLSGIEKHKKAEDEKYSSLLAMEWEYWSGIKEVTLGGNMSTYDCIILMCLVGCDMDICNRNYKGLLFFTFMLNLMRDKVLPMERKGETIACFATETLELCNKGEAQNGKTKNKA